MRRMGTRWRSEREMKCLEMDPSFAVKRQGAERNEHRQGEGRGWGGAHRIHLELGGNEINQFTPVGRLIA